jgi:hypothetical protein
MAWRAAEEDEAMRLERLDEAVKVRADFQGGRATPVLIRRRTQELEVKRITARWEDRRGSQKVHYFSVQVPSGDVYQLEFYSGDLLWKLNSVMLEG